MLANRETANIVPSDSEKTCYRILQTTMFSNLALLTDCFALFFKITKAKILLSQSHTDTTIAMLNAEL